MTQRATIRGIDKNEGQVIVRMPKSMKKELRHLAIDMETTVSYLIRRYIAEGLHRDSVGDRVGER